MNYRRACPTLRLGLALFLILTNTALAADCPTLYSKLRDKVNAAVNWVTDKLDQSQDYTPDDRIALVGQYLRHLTEGSVAVPSGPGSAATFVQKGKYFLASTAKAILKTSLQTISPIPSLSLGKKTELENIFLALYKNPAFEPSPAQAKLLDDAGVTRQFQGKKQFFLAHPNLTRASNGFAASAKAASGLSAGALVMNAAMALNQAKEMSDHTLTIDDFLAQPGEDDDGTPVVQLLTETVPFPHSAIRIGYKVYSFGFTQETPSDINQYLAAAPDEAQKQAAANPNAVVVDMLYPVKQSKNFLNYNLQRASDRSIRVNNLYLKKAEIAKLQRDFESSTGKTYTNKTFVNDCTTMLNRALSRDTSLNIPVGVDTLPSTASSYLSLRRLLGDSRIGPTQLVTFQKGSSAGLHLARNTLVAMEEGKVALLSAPYNMAERAYLSLTTPEDKLQYYGPKMQKEVDEFKSEATASVDEELQQIIGKAASLDYSKGSAQKTKIANQAKEILEDRLQDIAKDAQEKVDDPSADFKDVIIASAKLDALSEIRARWLEKLGFRPASN